MDDAGNADKKNSAERSRRDQRYNKKGPSVFRRAPSLLVIYLTSNP